MTEGYLSGVFGLAGRRALVTGSTRGIGAAIARGYVRAGAETIVHGTSWERAEAGRDEIRAEGGRAEAVAADLALPGAGRSLVETCEARFGPLDILVLNASAQVNAPLDALAPDDLRLQIDVNLRATIGMLQAALPGMAERGWGRVVGIGSVNQARPKGIVSAYAATKAAQHNLIQSQARDYAEHGVLLNTLAPGLVDTDRNHARKEADPEGFAAYAASLNWLGRVGAAEEMVGAAIFLASDACSFMTGECLFLTGGT